MTCKLTYIPLVLSVVLCLLFQHDSVGYTSGEWQGEVLPIMNSDSDSIPVQIKNDSIISLADTSKDDDAIKSKIKYHARDSMRVHVDSSIVYLFGDATVDYEDLHLKADFIKIDMGKKELYAEGSRDSLGQLIGKPEFSQADQKFRSSEMRYNFESKKGKISYVITKEGEGYIHGEVVKKDPFNNFYIRNGEYTTCDLDTPHFAIRSRRLKVVSNNKIVTGPAFLVIEEIPTPLVIPFGFFPNKKGRSSGLIFPAFGESNQRGFYFQHLGYYLGLNDYINFAFTTDLYTKGSSTYDVSSIYAKRYHYRGDFKLSYSNTLVSERELPDFSQQKDFHINWTHSQDPKAKPNSSFNASVNAGTSKFYRNTITTADNFLTNTFQSSITYQKTFPDKPYNLGLSMNHSQNTQTHIVNIALPNVNFGVSRVNPFKKKNQVGAEKWYQSIGFNYQMTGKNFVETIDSLLFKEETLKNMQNGVQHTLPISTSIKVLKYFSLAPSVNMSDRMYLKTLRYNWNPETKRVDTVEVKNFTHAFDYSSSAGLSTRIYGMYQFTKGPIVALRHVINPTAAFTYHPDYGQYQYGYYKNVQLDTTGRQRQYSIFERGVYGGPSAGRYGNISFGLDNNIEMKVKASSDTGATLKKIKLFESLRISGNYNMAADSMKLSVFNLSARTTLFDKLGITFNSTLDPYAYNPDNPGLDYNRFQYDLNKQLARLTAASLSVNFSLSGKRNEVTTPKYSKQELDEIRQHPEDYVDFNIPYNLTIGYSYSYSKIGNFDPNKSQSASINGDVNLTDKLKVSFNSWYDFKAKQFTNFGLNIYRDLHCWEMRINWIPFGFQQSYTFQINVKSSILQDLKLIKKKDIYDR